MYNRTFLFPRHSVCIDRSPYNRWHIDIPSVNKNSNIYDFVSRSIYNIRQYARSYTYVLFYNVIYSLAQSYCFPPRGIFLCNSEPTTRGIHYSIWYICYFLRSISLWNVLLLLFWNIFYINKDWQSQNFHSTISLNVTWANTCFGSTPGNIKVIVATKFAFCLPNLEILTGLWATKHNTLTVLISDTLSNERSRCSSFVAVRRFSLSISFKSSFCYVCK